MLLTAALVFSAGVVSFVSPCVLPLVPGYLAVMTGFAPERPTGVGKRLAAGPAVKFLSGFLVMFVILGASASSIGRLVQADRLLLERIGGVLIFAFGLILIAKPAQSWVARFIRPAGVVNKAAAHGGAIGLGVAFAVSFTPCATPILASVLTLAGSSGSLPQGLILLVAYGLGLAVPFFAIALGARRLFETLRKLRAHRRSIEIAAALVLAITGVAIATGSLYSLTAPL